MVFLGERSHSRRCCCTLMGRGGLPCYDTFSIFQLLCFLAKVTQVTVALCQFGYRTTRPTQLAGE